MAGKKKKPEDELEDDDDLILDDDITGGEGDGDDDSIDIDLDDEDDNDDDDDSNDDDDKGAGKKKANHKFAEMRTENTDLKRTVDDLRQKVEDLGTTQQPVNNGPQTPDANDPANWTEEQWDDLAKKDWKKAVDLRSELKAKSLMNTSREQSTFEKGQEQAKTDVIKRHPELNDGNSEKAKIYRNIVTANPEYLNQKKGPLMAMYEMEEYMEQTMGYKRDDIVKAEKRGADGEAARQNRVDLSATRGRTPAGGGGNKIKLSRDEVDFCKINGINPKSFAANKKKLETAGKGGIQL